MKPSEVLSTFLHEVKRSLSSHAMGNLANKLWTTEISCQFKYDGLTKAKLSCLLQLLKDIHKPTAYILQTNPKEMISHISSSSNLKTQNQAKKMWLREVFQCYLKAFEKMITEIIIQYRKAFWGRTCWPPSASSRLISL